MRTGRIVDSILRWGCDEWGGGILSVQNREDGLDVERLEGAGGSEGGFFVADVEGAVVEPDVCFDAYCADGEGCVGGVSCMPDTRRG